MKNVTNTDTGRWSVVGLFTKTNVSPGNQQQPTVINSCEYNSKCNEHYRIKLLQDGPVCVCVCVCF